jgi:ribokinase
LAAIAEPGILLLQNELPAATVEYAIAQAKSGGWLVIYNPAPARAVSPEILSKVDIIIPNETEATALVGRSINCENDAEAAAKELLKAGVKAAVITLGSCGVVWADAGRTCRLEAIKVAAVDTTAAGDAFTGALAVALSEGLDCESSLVFANAAAALSVTRMGAQSSLGCREEVEGFIKTCR